MTFRVGMKVVCIDAKNNKGKHWRGDKPVRGRVYTISGLCVSPDKGEDSLLLLEIKNKHFDSTGYLARRFRPVQERKTSIEIFTAMLNPQTRKENA